MSTKKRLLIYPIILALVLSIISPGMLRVSGAFSGALQFDADGKFTVMQVCDIQDDQSVDSAVISAITNNIARYQPDLVVFTGDNITESISSVSNFQSSVNQFLAPLLAANTKFAVTFGNHDSDGSGGSLSSQYAYYATHGGDNFIDHDIVALDGDASGVIPVYPYGQSGGTPAYQVYVMDSGHNPSSGSYDACYTSQVDYYIQRSILYPDVPSLWFQHVIVPDVYTRCMTTSGSGTSYSGKGTPWSSSTYYIDPARINYARSYSNNIADMYKEAPCPSNQSVYEAAAHRSSSTYGSKTLYEAWRDYGNLKGAYFGHDHLNKFTCTTSDGIDIGYGKGTTMYKTLGIISYNDGNPGCSIYQLDINGSYSTRYSANTDFANVMVTYNANGGSGVMNDQFITKNSGSTLNANSFSKAYYSFAGWNTAANGSGTSYANGAAISVGTADFTLYAQWVPSSYNITFNANGGTGGTGPVSMQYLSTLTAPAVARTGYTFSGWSPTVPATVPPADTTYTAQWSANSYSVHYNSNGGDAGSTPDSAHIYDVAKDLTANGYTRTGYSFTGWNAAANGTGASYSDGQSVINLAAANNAVVTFYAMWSVNRYNITFNANGGTGGTGPVLMEYGAALAAPAIAKTGYNLTGWSPEVPATVPAADTTYTAQWSARVHSIVFDANGGMGGTGGAMAYGTPLTPPTVTKTGHSFAGWSPAVPATVPDADATYTAQWSASSYAITFDTAGGTGGTSAAMVFDTALSPPSVSKAGFTFIGWSPEVPVKVPAANSTYTAQWSQNTNNVVYNANGGNGGTSATMTVGAPIISPVMTKSGCLFTGWAPALPGFVTDGFNTYSAKWAVNSYQITFDANGGAGGTKGLMEYGLPLAAPSVSHAGFTFAGWSPAVPSTVPAENTTYTAQWTRDKIEIIFDANGGTGGTSSLMTFGVALTPPVVTRAGYIFTGWQPAVPSAVVAGNQTYTAKWESAG